MCQIKLGNTAYREKGQFKMRKVCFHPDALVISNREKRNRKLHYYLMKCQKVLVVFSLP